MIQKQPNSSNISNNWQMSISRKKLPVIGSLEKHMAMGHISRKTIPDPQALQKYKCQLVVSQVEGPHGQISEQIYLQFVHKTNGTIFTVNITDVAYSSSAYHELQWTENCHNSEQMISNEAKLGDMIGISLAVNCLDYQHPQLNPHYIQPVKSQFIEEKRTKSQYIKQYLKQEVKQEKKTAFQVLNGTKQQNNSNLGSDADSFEEDRKFQPKPIHNFREPNEFRMPDQKNLLDYTNDTKILIRYNLLEFLKINENRFKKLLEIKQFLRGIRYNVPQKRLKELLSELCVSNIMDKTRGYLLKEVYLTPQQLQKREQEEQQLRNKMMNKDKKKRTKKQSKKTINRNPQFLSQQNYQQTLSPFEQLQLKEAKIRGKSKKRIE